MASKSKKSGAREQVVDLATSGGEEENMEEEPEEKEEEEEEEMPPDSIPVSPPSACH